MIYKVTMNKHNKKEPVVENKNSLNYPTRTLDPPISLVDIAREIEKSEETIKINVKGKLDLILKQIEALKNEAREIIKKAHEDVELHKIKCGFSKIPGESIYLYKKKSGELYFSRLSPADWDNDPPDEFIGTYVLNFDRSFKKVD